MGNEKSVDINFKDLVRVAKNGLGKVFRNFGGFWYVMMLTIIKSTDELEVVQFLNNLPNYLFSDAEKPGNLIFRHLNWFYSNRFIIHLAAHDIQSSNIKFLCNPLENLLDVVQKWALNVTATWVNMFFSSESSWKPKTQPNDSRAAVWLSFWFPTRPSADTVTD